DHRSVGGHEDTSSIAQLLHHMNADVRALLSILEELQEKWHNPWIANPFEVHQHVELGLHGGRTSRVKEADQPLQLIHRRGGAWGRTRAVACRARRRCAAPESRQLRWRVRALIASRSGPGVAPRGQTRGHRL